MITTCPDADALAAFAFDDEPDAAVRGHVDSCPDCRGRLDEMRLGLSTLRNLWQQQNTIGLATPPRGAVRPAQVGKYLIVGTLGEGAQAVVYRGLHPTLNRDVVLKLGRHPADPDDLGRAHLVNEGKVLAVLEHPHIARVLDLDFHEGRPYLVMEFIRGVDLEEYATAARPAPADSAALVAKLARGLSVAHAAGVVHHDIKPRNVLVADDGRPVLIDFGLAWLRGDRDQAEQDGAPGGTLAYMAPEHARGEVERIGAHTDVFGLGGVLYFLLTGKALFAAADVFAAQQKAMRCDYDAAALDQGDVPRALARLCRRALAARPEDRPASAAAFADELERLAQPPAPPRWRRPAALGGVAAAGLAASVAVAAWLWPGATPALPQSLQVQELVRVHRRTVNGVPKLFRPPVRPDAVRQGDLFDVRCEVPRGAHAVLFWLDTEGRLHQCDLTADGETEAGQRLRFPAEDLERIGGPPGTELILVLASRSTRPLPDREAVAALLPGGAWPKLDDRDALLLHRDGVEDPGRGPGGRVVTPRGTVRNRLEKLRKELRLTCDWFWGIAIPHLE